MQLLKLLNKQFKARITGKELSEFFRNGSSDGIDLLWKKGILAMAGSPDRIACPLGDHDDDPMVLADKKADGLYWGYCQEHKKDVSVPSAECELVEFHPSHWFDAVRSMNGIEGDAVVSASGHCFLGIFKTETLRMGVTIISANAIGEEYRPLSTSPRLGLWIHLGDKVAKKSNDDSVWLTASDLFKDSPIKFHAQAITKALASLPAIRDPGHQNAYEKITNQSTSPVGLTSAQYKTEIQPKNLKKFDLFIDLSSHRAWRKGKEVAQMKTKNEKKKLKPISKRGLELVASYMQVPSVQRAPILMEPYLGDVDKRDPDSATKMIANIRTALHLENIIKTHSGRGGIRGDSVYSFAPDDGFTYALITPVHT